MASWHDNRAANSSEPDGLISGLLSHLERGRSARQITARQITAELERTGTPVVSRSTRSSGAWYFSLFLYALAARFSWRLSEKQ